MADRLFNSAPIGPPARRRNAERLIDAHPGEFASQAEASAFLAQVFVPKSRRWAFCGNGKSGTSTTKRFLYYMEFGHHLTAAFDAPNDINPDAVAHRLGDADIIRPVLRLPDGLGETKNALRVAVVRHPLARAVSSFLYLCQTHDRAHVWMVNDRLRMDALVGFDWGRDCRTEKGFAKFLEYVGLCGGEAAMRPVNAHWRPQVHNIRPDVFRPEVLGRLEAMPAFFDEVAARLGRALPEGWHLPAANRNPERFDHARLLSPATRALVAEVYAGDFAWLGYQPDDPL